MASGLPTTFRTLAITRNEAALPWLLRALDSSDSAIQTAAVRAILARPGNGGHRELLQRWQNLTEAQLQVADQNASKLSGAIRDGVLSSDFEFNRNSCDAAVRLRDYDLIPCLVRAAEDKSNPHAERAAETAVALASSLGQELHEPRDYSNRRDPVLVRQFVYSSLETSVRQFGRHRRAPLIEAFLLLVEKDDSLLKQVLADSSDPAFATIVGHFNSSSRPGIIRLICELLEEPHTPAPIVHAAVRRRDPAFLQVLLRKASEKLSPAMLNTLRRIDTWGWLRDGVDSLTSLSDDELTGAVQLAMASSINRLQTFEVVKFALQHGGPRSRRAAVTALVEFKGGEANEMVLLAIADSDPHVQAAAVSQLRERAIPNALQRLVEMLTSPHEVVRTAVHAAMGEFTFQRYLGAFEMLDAETRALTGSLVKQVDPDAVPQLKAEMNSASRSRRIRGIEMTIAMQVAYEVEDELLRLSCDQDHFIRAAAAEALGMLTSQAAKSRLEELCLDRTISVQEVAEKSLEETRLIPDPFAHFVLPPIPTADMH